MEGNMSWQEDIGSLYKSNTLKSPWKVTGWLQLKIIVGNLIHLFGIGMVLFRPL
jgi:hypothetical protein